MKKKQIYEQGDIIFLDCSPQAGHEQSGRRPVLVVSNEVFNSKSGGLMLVCPITNTIKGNPFHVPFPTGEKTTGVVLADQIRSLDIYARNPELYDKAPIEVVEEVMKIVTEIMEIPA